MPSALTVLSNRIRTYTSKIEPWWAIVGAPIVQEFFFRFIPYQFFYLPSGRYWTVGIISTLIFASIHWYFGKRFVIYALVVGLFVYWWTMVNYGLIFAILAHSAFNIVDLSIGFRYWLAGDRIKKH